MITPEQHAEIRRLYFGQHWKVGTIVTQLGVHPDTVRAAIALGTRVVPLPAHPFETSLAEAVRPCTMPRHARCETVVRPVVITIPTTFVVGAGGSQPYGLPVGSELHGRARAIKNNDQANAMFRVLAVCGSGEGRMADLLDDLRAHPAESIDAFLESRQHLPPTVSSGKVLIAALMGQAIAEAGQVGRNAKTDWLGYVVEKMRKAAPTWEAFVEGNAQVRFVTFNFDTLIEDRLYPAVRAIYRDSDVNMPRVRDAVQVMHVHGALPEITAEAREHLKGIAAGDVNAAATEWIEAAARSINIALEQLPPHMLAPLQNAVLRRGVLCFLGFAYDSVNLAKLGLPPRIGTVPPESQIFGSACGLLEGEKASVKRYFNNRITLGGHDQECREVLRALEVFQD